MFSNELDSLKKEYDQNISYIVVNILVCIVTFSLYSRFYLKNESIWDRATSIMVGLTLGLALYTGYYIIEKFQLKNKFIMTVLFCFLLAPLIIISCFLCIPILIYKIIRIIALRRRIKELDSGGYKTHSKKNRYHNKYKKEDFYEQYTKLESNSNSLDDLYKVLECSPDYTNVDIKRKYRQLAKKYHSDIYASKGLPNEIIKIIDNKFNDINRAYEEIKKVRRFK